MNENGDRSVAAELPRNCDIVADGLWPEDLKAATEQQVNWIWEGYLAPGAVTLLTSQWKTGKTTLLSVLLDKRRHDGTFAGLALRGGKTAVVSEEPTLLWLLRSQKLDFGSHVCLFCRPFRGKPK